MGYLERLHDSCLLGSRRRGVESGAMYYFRLAVNDQRAFVPPSVGPLATRGLKLSVTTSTTVA